jgi:membrane-associated HD superfamily phosphohydrolase
VPIFVVIYYKYPKRGLYVTIGAIIVGLFLSVAPTLPFGILPKVQFLQMESFEELFQSIAWYYLATNCYVVSFLVGVLGGYFLKNNIKLDYEKEVIAWIISVLTIILVFMWNNTFWKLNKSAPLYSVLLWYSFGKLFSATAFTWIYFALCTGRARMLCRNNESIFF